jgi:hypothetical protein
MMVVLSMLLAVAAPAEAGSEDAGVVEMKVLEPNTFVYEEPNPESAVLRRLYLGELLKALAVALPATGARWVKVSLGDGVTGFVRAEKLGPPRSELKESIWRPRGFVRDERPFVLGVRVAGETLGVAVNFRYQPFTRLGISLSTGAVVDPSTQRGAVGPHFAFGVYSAFLLFNVSPIIEIGISHSTYSNGVASLQLTNLYGLAGLEWMTSFGFFLHVYVAYVRAIDMSLSFPVGAINGSGMERPSFGMLNDPVQAQTFNLFFPGLSLGYAF